MRIKESLTYIGPNRRADVCLIENLIELDNTEQRYISANAVDYRERVLTILQASGIDTAIEALSDHATDGTALETLAGLYAGSAIAIQRAAGHEVHFAGRADDSDPNRVRALFEYEQVDVGDHADMLVNRLFAEAIPELEWDFPDSAYPGDFAGSFASFREFAEPFILPLDTRGIIDAAVRMDIPWVKLERLPYQGLEGDFRIRKNSLLKLGHSTHQHIVDGTLCIDKGHRPKPDITVGKQVSGETYKVIVVNGELIGVVTPGTGQDLSREMHPETLRPALSLADSVGAGMSVIDIVTQDIHLPLQESGGAIVDLDISPELDSFLPAGSDLHRKAMSAFVRWLFPEGTASRIPLVSITGTNGKTTTSRMIAKIMQTGQYITGLACSDGIYIDGELTDAGDKSGSGGHHRVFESHEVDMGVLETARGALAHSGFVFDWCNVAVCLNVTMDHLGRYGVDTLKQMAELKRSVLERARDGVVLFADDEYCVGMLPGLTTPRICLVSMASPVEELRSISNAASCFSVLETIDGSDWLVLYDGSHRTAVIAVDKVPSTFTGKATFNISNALHALAACHLMGVEIATIRTGLQNYVVNYETAPGRLNFYDEHPFTVILDYAHNADGFSKLGAFVDQLEIQGKKVVMMQARADYGEDFVTQLATAAAGHFDHYVCRSHPVYTGPDPLRVLALMKEALLSSGVEESQVTTTTNTEFAVETTLQMGSDGDLLVFAPGVGQREETWKRIISFPTP